MQLSFSSSALAVVEEVADVDVEAVAAHLHAAPMPVGRTFFRGVGAVAPGTLLEIGRQGIVSRRWWSLHPDRAARDATPEQRTGELVELLEEVVADYAVTSDVGVTLSGGSDSTAVAAAWQRSAGGGSRRAALLWALPMFPQADESRQAVAVAHHLGLEPIPVEADRRWPLFSGSEVLSTPERPTPLGFVEIWNETFATAVRHGVRVLMTGSGGDQLFGAGEYFSYADLVLSGKLGETWRRWSRHRRRAGRDAWLHAWDWLGRPLAVALLPRRRTILPLPWIGMPLRGVVRRLAEPDSRWWLPWPGVRSRGEALMPGALAPPVVDLGERGESHGVECRHPLLDHRLLEWAASLPPGMLLLNGRRKGLLRSAVEPFLSSPEIGTLSKVRLDSFMRHAVRVERKRVDELLHDSIAVEAGWLDAAGLAALRDGIAEDNFDLRVWPVLTLESWLRRHLER